MQNKDNLEEFIKKEVSQIKFDDADSMWQEFQIRIEKEKPEPKSGFWYRIGFFSLFLFIALGSYLLGSFFNQTKIADLNKDEGILIEKKLSPSNQSYSEQNQKQSSNNQSIVNDDDNSTQSGRSNKLDLQNEASVGSTSPNSIEIIPTEIDFGSVKTNPKENVNNIFPNQNNQGSPTSGVIDSTQMKKEFEQKYVEQAGSEEMIDKGNSEEYFKSFVPIEKLEIKEILLLNSEKNPPLIALNSKWKAPQTKSLFLSIENSFANNGIRQHALGFGKYFPLKNDFGIKVQAGGSLDVGYSFSQDSVFILNGLSIEETRKDKDLKNLWNAYLDLGFYHRKNRWQFGLGFRGSYALFNQFYYVETTRITHLGTFNTLAEETNERDGKGNWSGINRMSLDAYLNINYQINTNYSVGLFAGKRLNELIKNNMANQAYSNTPVKFGVVINKLF